jgi:hypothetical protein
MVAVLIFQDAADRYARTGRGLRCQLADVGVEGYDEQTLALRGGFSAPCMGHIWVRELTVATTAFSFDSPMARYMEISCMPIEDGLKLSTTAIVLRLVS